jgi:hypothetical protein
MKVSAFKYEIETVGLLYLVRHVFAMVAAACLVCPLKQRCDSMVLYRRYIQDVAWQPHCRLRPTVTVTAG